MMKEDLCWRYAHPCGLSALAELLTLSKTVEEIKRKRKSEVHFGQSNRIYETASMQSGYIACAFANNCFASFALNM